MNKQSPNLTEEHVVAWLDGELDISRSDIDASLSHDAELSVAARELTALGRIFSRSRHDSRFRLSARTDARTRASIERELDKNRKTVRMPERAPLAEPIPGSPAIQRTKKIWVRRSSYALALLAVFAIVWYGVRPNEQAPVTATITAPATSPAPSAITPAAPSVSVQMTTPEAGSDQAVPHTSEHRMLIAKAAPNTEHSVKNRHANNASTTQDIASSSIAATSTPAAKEPADPAAVMISHRFAKMLKTTPVVVITDQDKIAQKM